MIELSGVTKEYRRAFGRPTRAVDGVSLRVAAGERVALLGPNGAGKSTLLGLILGYLRPTRGGLRVGGLRPREYARRHGIGHLPEQVRVPPGLRVGEVLRRLAVLDGLAGRELRAAVDGALERTGLEAARNERSGRLSKGTRKRLGVAQLLLRPRRLVLLDEPWAGLDPAWRARLRTLIREGIGGERPTVLVASHELDEAERVAGRAVVVRRGRVAASVRLDDRGRGVGGRRGRLEELYVRACGTADGPGAGAGAEAVAAASEWS